MRLATDWSIWHEVTLQAASEYRQRSSAKPFSSLLPCSVTFAYWRYYPSRLKRAGAPLASTRISTAAKARAEMSNDESLRTASFGKH